VQLIVIDVETLLKSACKALTEARHGHEGLALRARDEIARDGTSFSEGLAFLARDEIARDCTSFSEGLRDGTSFIEGLAIWVRLPKRFIQ